MALMTSKKTVLITGLIIFGWGHSCGKGGIGHALAREFYAKGLHVFATARNKDSISDLEAMGMDTLSLEVTSQTSIAEAKEEVTRRTGGSLDYLVNNAGRNYTVPALDIDISEVELTFSTNVFAVILICQAFSPLLVASKGTIIQIGSLAAVMPYVFGSVYNATKAALHAYSDTLRVELAPYDVKVLVVVTGGVQSNIARTHRQLPAGSLYVDVDKEYQRRLKHSQEGAMSNEVYAKGVVAAALKKKQPEHLWRGNMAWAVWFVWTFFPHGFLGRWYFPRAFGLDRLARLVRTQKEA